MPAQLTAIRSGRSLPVASSIAACTELSSVTSVRTKVAEPPSSAASACPLSSCRSRIVTAEPAALSALTVASPSPEAPPETTAATSRFLTPRRLVRPRAAVPDHHRGAEVGRTSPLWRLSPEPAAPRGGPHTLGRPHY